MIKNTNDGTDKAPYLRVDMNYGGCNDLPPFSSGPKGDDQEKQAAISEAGFGGIQDGDPALCKALGLALTAHARMNQVGDLDALLPKWKDGGYNCATLHVGWGMESDDEVNRLVEYVLNSSVKYDLPIYIENPSGYDHPRHVADSGADQAISRDPF